MIRSGEDPVRQARAEAAAWLARLQSSERTAADEGAFARWLDSDQRHREAFDAVTNAWEAVGSIRDWPRRGFEVQPRLARRAVLAGVAAGGMALSVVGFVALANRSQTYATDVGESRRVRLADGSFLSLDTASSVRVSLATKVRRVELERGRAFMEVAKDPSRPFRVVAAGHEVVARGTAFEVAVEGERLSVILTEGKVDVQAQRRLLGALAAGERLIVAGSEARVDRPDMSKVTAWRQGRLVLDGDRLAQAVAEMNRYDNRKIVLANPKLGELTISGAYTTGRPEAFAISIATLFDLHVINSHDRIVITSRS